MRAPRGRRLARVARAQWALWSALAALLVPADGSGVELLDGRVQIHGYAETQIRAMARDFDANDRFDVSQWYLIGNVEVELDLLPDGWGPFDMVSGYVRAEGRYDCVWSGVCEVFPSADTYGDRAQRLPKRLSDGRRNGLIGVISPSAVEAGDGTTLDFRDKRPYIRTPLGQNGLRFAVGPLARPVPAQRHLGRLWNVPGLGTIFYSLPGLDPDGVDGNLDPIVDPGLGDDDVSGCFTNSDSPLPCRYSGAYVSERFFGYRFGVADTRGPFSGNGQRILGPWRPKDTVFSYGALRDRVNPYDPDEENPVMVDENGDPSVGLGALPFRPQAALAVDADGDGVVDDETDRTQSRGVHYPSDRLVRARSRSDFGAPPVNFSERDLRWNRGDAQEQTKELKEAYLDIEMLDHRLWIRGGRQAIVWGKTELFRSQDQFNPQDLGIASLPSLEESRVPLWSLRSIYSFYDVGPLEDVRVEGALVYDEFQPLDIGRCGEPYAPPQACDLSAGLFAHGLVGLGLAGEQRPRDPWDDADDFEGGVRIEWRWNRASFSLSNFYGFPDVPHIELIQSWERNVDPTSGRPRNTGATGPCVIGNEADCLGGVIAGDVPGDPAEDTFPGLARPDPDDVLPFHHANQSLFATICASTIGVTALLPNACSFNVWNSDDLTIPDDSLTPTWAQAFSAMLQGRGFEDSPSFIASTNGKLIMLTVARWSTDGDLVPSTEGGTDEDFMPLVGLHRNRLPDGEGGRIDGDNPNAARRAAFPDDFMNPLWAPVGITSALTTPQEAVVGCGDYWGTDCDIHGFDFFSSEASALFQAFPGVEGTEGNTWDTFDGSRPQPATVGFDGGPVCTRYDRATGRQFVLPGCRGVESTEIFSDQKVVLATFDPGYDVTVDGCVFAPTIGDHAVMGVSADGSPVDLSLCVGNVFFEQATTLYHPYAGCLTPADELAGISCTFDVDRNFDAEFLGLVPGRSAQVFRNELAALSWNFLMSMVATSVPPDRLGDGDSPPCDPADPKEPDGCSDRPPRFDEFDVNDSERLDGCSFRRPFLCKNVTAMLGTTGAQRNTIRAGGNQRFGRRDFQWHGGGVAVLDYDRRNVLGFSFDFAEDWTKTSWGFELTWFDHVPMADNGEFDGLSDTQHFNLTASMDRPTFIRFLNPSRTFFFNSQVFLQYIDGYHDSFVANGPLNALFTFAVTTGYFQDRLSPSLVLAHETRSVSGAVIGSLTYRYTTNFSVTIGIAGFYGREERATAPLSPIAGPSGGAGKGSQRAYVENGLSAIRDRDEVFLRLRYTF